MKILNGNKVLFSRADIALFNAKWPGDQIAGHRSYWFQFDDGGDLIDTDVPEHQSVYATRALMEDAQAYFCNDVYPDWWVE